MPQEPNENVLLSLSVPCDQLAPSTVRRNLAEISGMNGCLGDILLIASELVTNAVVHSHCPEDSELNVTLTSSDGSLVLCVEDPGDSGGVARVVENRPLGAGGLGLRIVEELSSSWGQEGGESYRVWATVSGCGHASAQPIAS
jgi:anti-sigma regulatory factor (Ser/Thr protein kinase)